MRDVSVSGSDLRRLRTILALTRTEEGAGLSATGVLYEVLELLEELLHSDFVSFQEMHVGPGSQISRSYVQATQAGERGSLDAVQIAEFDRENPADTIEAYWWQLPCSLVDRTGRSQVSTIRTFFSEREWAAHPVKVDYLNFTDEILLAYPTGAGNSYRILSARETGSSYGIRELTLMELLQPHLLPLLRAVRDETGSSGWDGSALPLTERQWEILHLVALGLPNKLIGRELGISEGTVRKHLENGFGRIGVHNRTEAVHWLHAQEGVAVS